MHVIRVILLNEATDLENIMPQIMGGDNTMGFSPNPREDSEDRMSENKDDVEDV